MAESIVDRRLSARDGDGILVRLTEDLHMPQRLLIFFDPNAALPPS